MTVELLLLVALSILIGIYLVWWEEERDARRDREQRDRGAADHARRSEVSG